MFSSAWYVITKPSYLKIWQFSAALYWHWESRNGTEVRNDKERQQNIDLGSRGRFPSKYWMKLVNRWWKMGVYLRSVAIGMASVSTRKRGFEALGGLVWSQRAAEQGWYKGCLFTFELRWRLPAKRLQIDIQFRSVRSFFALLGEPTNLQNPFLKIFQNKS